MTNLRDVAGKWREKRAVRVRIYGGGEVVGLQMLSGYGYIMAH